MSAVMAEGGAPAPAKKSKKKLMILAGGALLVLVILAVGVTLYLRSKAAHAAAEEAADEDGAPHAAAKIDPMHAPAYLPLDPFVVNLADRTIDRYAQIGITLELDNPAVGDELRAYMPAIRNSILMILANKASTDLLDRAGKERLALEIQREVVRPLGIEPSEIEPLSSAAMSSSPMGAAPSASAPAASSEKVASADSDEPKAKAKAKGKAKKGDHNPVTKVHFSTFIIQ